MTMAVGVLYVWERILRFPSVFETHGMLMINCSSASLATSGCSLSLSVHSFLVMALPEPWTLSLRVVMLSKSIC